MPILRRGISLLLILFTFALLLPSNVMAGGGLVFSETVWDAGKLDSIGPQTHIFKFTNKSKGSVVIKEIIPSCGCTVAFISKKKLYRHGESGVIKVVLDPSGKSGKFSTNVRVITKQSRKPYLLTLKAEIATTSDGFVSVKFPEPKISVTPAVVDLGDVNAGERVIYRIVVANIGDGDLFILNFTAKNQDTGMPLSSKAIKNGKKIELTAFYTAPNSGKFQGSMVIESNDPVTPTVNVSIRGRVR